MLISDQSILSRVDFLSSFRAGSKESYSVIFRNFYQPLCFYVAKMDVDDFTAEEIVQDVFIKLWDKRKDFDRLESLKSFLYVSCRNAALNFLDKTKRLSAKKDQYFGEYSDQELPVLYDITYAETLREISTAIANLPEQCKNVISLLYQEGLTPIEVADELGITTSTVYNQKQRGLEILRKTLTKDQLFFLLYLVPYFLGK